MLTILPIQIPPRVQTVPLDCAIYARFLATGDRREGYAFLADGWNGLRIIDVSDPARPEEVAFYEPGGRYTRTMGVALSGNDAYLADGSDGLWVVDVSDPRQPVQKGSYDQLCYAQDLAVQNDLVYAADWIDGLRVIDVGRPTEMFEVGSFPTRHRALALALWDEHIYVADCFDGIYILRYTPTGFDAGNVHPPRAVTALGPVFPNPFNPRLTICIDMARGAHARLGIHDLAGRRVDLLLDQVLPVGRHQIDWKGLNRSGQEVASGVYVVRLETGAETRTRRVVLLR